jgi:tetratricopeptide (TPR) repeat protein
MGNISTALKLFEQVYAISKKTGSLVHYADSLAGLGVCHRGSDNLKAMNLLKRAIKMEEVIGRDTSRSRHLASLGICYYQQGDYDEAIRLCEQSLSIVEDSGTLGNLGLYYRAKGDVRKSIELHSRALALDQKAGRVHQQAHHLANLGICHETADPAKAIIYFGHALELYRSTGLPDGHPGLSVNRPTRRRNYRSI